MAHATGSPARTAAASSASGFVTSNFRVFGPFSILLLLTGAEGASTEGDAFLFVTRCDFLWLTIEIYHCQEWIIALFNTHEHSMITTMVDGGDGRADCRVQSDDQNYNSMADG